MTDPIQFYSRRTKYYEFSNFAPFGFEDEGLNWPTVEHFFQAQKFIGAQNAAYKEVIRAAKTPKEAKSLGRTRRIAIRPDWDEIKDDVMLYAIRRKFASGKFRQLL
jgi:N-glycosidase YbiA